VVRVFGALDRLLRGQPGSFRLTIKLLEFNLTGLRATEETHLKTFQIGLQYGNEIYVIKVFCLSLSTSF